LAEFATVRLWAARPMSCCVRALASNRWMAARKRVEQDYGIETMVEHLLAIYNEVLTGTKG
jgi:glycosyltransferase involved in cell wall biosynthesis